MIVFISTFIVIALSLLYYVTTKNHNYWKKKNVVSCPNPKPIFGNYSDYILFKKFVGEVSQDICRALPNEPYIGTFYGSDPALLVQDPDILKIILTKDFYYFSSREVSQYTHKEVVTHQNLFFTYGDRWKVLRQNLTPIFTTAKMKLMFGLIVDCCRILEKSLDLDTKASDAIEVRALAAKYTIETIGSCGFGIETNSMLQSEQNPFIIIGNKIIDNSTIRGLVWNARVMWPSVFYGLGLKSFPAEVYKFFDTVSTKIFKARDYKPTARNDFIDCILNLKNNKYITGDSIRSVKDGDNKKIVMDVDNDMLVGLCMMFFTGGFETSSSTISYTLYELAKNKEAQRRAQQEIDEYLKAHDNKLTYDCVTSLTYTEACVDEALRLYPVLAVLTREVAEDYTFPSGLTLEKNSRVHIPLYHLHHNPKYFPDPEAFKPERFLPENKQNIKPYTYMPFGDGPRICIGLRFAKMQTLAGLLTILKKYSVELADGTPEKLQFDPRAVVTTPIGGIPLKFTPRDGWEQRTFNK
ncbi:cytochrome P450 6B4-like isoform X1 [Ostrinia furnacalis]|uniref:cytochrome P450 6B4-like isoform X1 n=1 Tax=Ostrinia furnacalis TaxID=93504 RepID=UPI001038BC64|nr:cytochrome P450 6B4-like isoform X1 [Ostrinia furnacalis]